MTANILIAKSKKFGAFPVLVDAEDLWIGEVLELGIWKSVAGAFYPVIYMPGEWTYLHTFLIYCPIGFVIDHINENTLDARKQNLQIITRGENKRKAKKFWG